MKSNINLLFGRQVASLRQERMLSQEELADLCGMHRTYIGCIERGEKSPRLESIEKIAKGLGVKIVDLFNNAE